MTGVASLFLTGIVAYHLRNIPFAPLRAGLGPAFFPVVVSIILGALGVTALAVGIVQGIRNPASGDLIPLTRRTTVLVPVVILYGVGIQLLGLLIPTIIFLLVSMLLLGVSRFQAILATALASAAIYVVFGILFRIRLF